MQKTRLVRCIEYRWLPDILEKFGLPIWSSWWFQPIWKIWVTMGIFHNFRGENKTYLSCHHPVMVSQKKKTAKKKSTPSKGGPVLPAQEFHISFTLIRTCWIRDSKIKVGGGNGLGLGLVVVLEKPILQMGVSKNSVTPKSSILIGFSILNHPFWGYPYFWKHPDSYSTEKGWKSHDITLKDALFTLELWYTNHVLKMSSRWNGERPREKRRAARVAPYNRDP